MTKQAGWLSVVFVVIIGVVGYYLLQEISVVQLWVGVFLGAMIYGLALVQYPKAIMKFWKEAMSDKTKMWLPFAIYVGLAVWVLVKIYG